LKKKPYKPWGVEHKGPGGKPGFIALEPEKNCRAAAKWVQKTLMARRLKARGSRLQKAIPKPLCLPVANSEQGASIEKKPGNPAGPFKGTEKEASGTNGWKTEWLRRRKNRIKRQKGTREKARGGRGKGCERNRSIGHENLVDNKPGIGATGGTMPQ